MAEYLTKTKKDINKVMFVGIFDKTNPIKENRVKISPVVPISDLHINNVVRLDCGLIIKKIKNPNIRICYTNDPLVTSAYDNINMGCFRIFIDFKDCKILDTKNSFCFIPKDMTINTNLPQRSLFKESERFIFPKAEKSLSLLFNKDYRNGMNIYYDGQMKFVNLETMYQEVV